jgi:hypothetical protein
MRLYLIQDGIKNVGYNKINDAHSFGSNYYLITYDFKTNEGYIDKRTNNWRLYTQVGQKLNQNRYYHFESFDGCIARLIELKGDNEIMICKKYN